MEALINMEDNVIEKPNLIMAPAMNEEELEALLRFRYRYFRIGRQRALVRNNVLGLDIDPWDLKSIHYAIKDSKSGDIVAYFRVVSSQLNPGQGILIKILEKYQNVFNQNMEMNGSPFPIMDYYPGAGEILRPYIQKIGLENICVASRLTVSVYYRHIVQIKHIFELIFNSLCATFSHCFITCSPNHLPFYQWMGFEVLDGPKKIGEKENFELFLLLIGKDENIYNRILY